MDEAHAVMDGFARGSARYFASRPERNSLEHELEREHFLQDVWLEVWSEYQNKRAGKRICHVLTGTS